MKTRLAHSASASMPCSPSRRSPSWLAASSGWASTGRTAETRFVRVVTPAFALWSDLRSFSLDEAHFPLTIRRLKSGHRSLCLCANQRSYRLCSTSLVS